MQNVLEQGPDFWCWCNKTQFSCIVFTHAKMFSIQMLLYTFQSNCAEGLHFSAFHPKSICYISYQFATCQLTMADGLPGMKGDMRTWLYELLNFCVTKISPLYAGNYMYMYISTPELKPN